VSAKRRPLRSDGSLCALKIIFLGCGTFLQDLFACRTIHCHHGKGLDSAVIASSSTMQRGHLPAAAEGIVPELDDQISSRLAHGDLDS
jgi:hypothetical protein